MREIDYTKMAAAYLLHALGDDAAKWAEAFMQLACKNDKILDAGPATVARLVAAITASKTLIWNGPLGVFEVPPFDAATVAVAHHAAALAKAGVLVAVGGGGDTVSALNHAGVVDDMTFVSTAGGAFLEWMEGKPLPGVEALRL